MWTTLLIGTAASLAEALIFACFEYLETRTDLSEQDRRRLHLVADGADTVRSGVLVAELIAGGASEEEKQRAEQAFLDAEKRALAAVAAARAAGA